MRLYVCMHVYIYIHNYALDANKMLVSIPLHDFHHFHGVVFKIIVVVAVGVGVVLVLVLVLVLLVVVVVAVVVAVVVVVVVVAIFQETLRCSMITNLEDALDTHIVCICILKIYVNIHIK